MQLEFSSIPPVERHHLMTQTILPRPIAWVLTRNGNQQNFNLAPYSFFTAICSDPPLVLFSAGKKLEGEEKGEPKDTRRNIDEQKEFVIHIPTAQQINQVQKSAALLKHGESEIEQLGLTTTTFEGVNLPRLADSPVAMACQLYRLDEVGHHAQAVIYGEITRLYVDDALLNEQNRIDPTALDPLAKLGGAFYSPLGSIMQPN